MAQEIKPSLRRRTGPSRKRLAEAINVYPGYPEHIIFHGARSTPRDIANRLNALEKEIAADPDPHGETVTCKRLIVQYLEAELIQEIQQRDQECTTHTNQCSEGNFHTDHARPNRTRGQPAHHPISRISPDARKIGSNTIRQRGVRRRILARCISGW